MTEENIDGKQSAGQLEMLSRKCTSAVDFTAISRLRADPFISMPLDHGPMLPAAVGSEESVVSCLVDGGNESIALSELSQDIQSTQWEGLAEVVSEVGSDDDLLDDRQSCGDGENSQGEVNFVEDSKDQSEEIQHGPSSTSMRKYHSSSAQTERSSFSSGKTS